MWRHTSARRNTTSGSSNGYSRFQIAETHQPWGIWKSLSLWEENNQGPFCHQGATHCCKLENYVSKPWRYSTGKSGEAYGHVSVHGMLRIVCSCQYHLLYTVSVSWNFIWLPEWSFLLPEAVNLLRTICMCKHQLLLYRNTRKSQLILQLWTLSFVRCWALWHLHVAALFTTFNKMCFLERPLDRCSSQICMLVYLLLFLSMRRWLRRVTTSNYMQIMRKADLVRKNMVRSVRNERNILAMTNNPFVVSFYYSFTNATNLYIVMEYCNGGDCYNLLKGLGCMDESIARLYIAETILALEYCHTKVITFPSCHVQIAVLKQKNKTQFYWKCMAAIMSLHSSCIESLCMTNHSFKSFLLAHFEISWWVSLPC